MPTTYRIIRPIANRMLGMLVYSTFGWFLGMVLYFGISTAAYFIFMPQAFPAEVTPRTFLIWILASGFLGGWVLFTGPLTLLGAIVGLIIGIEQTSMRMIPWRKPVPEHLRRPRPAPTTES